MDLSKLVDLLKAPSGQVPVHKRSAKRLADGGLLQRRTCSLLNWSSSMLTGSLQFFHSRCTRAGLGQFPPARTCQAHHAGRHRRTQIVSSMSKQAPDATRRQSRGRCNRRRQMSCTYVLDVSYAGGCPHGCYPRGMRTTNFGPERCTPPRHSGQEHYTNTNSVRKQAWGPDQRRELPCDREGNAYDIDNVTTAGVEYR